MIDVDTLNNPFTRSEVRALQQVNWLKLADFIRGSGHSADEFLLSIVNELNQAGVSTPSDSVNVAADSPAAANDPLRG